MNRRIWLIGIPAAALLVLAAQDKPPDISGVVGTTGGIPVSAVPDFRGAGEAQSFMNAFNQTLWSDLSGAGVLKMAPKTMYPLNPPQQQSDLTTAPPPPSRVPRKGQPPPPANGGGRWMTDWSGPPVSANYLAFGYGAVQNGVFVLLGWLDDV